jgi:AcrR family transcriptional regulator
MPRPVSIHDDALLAAARAVFLARGYQASTVEIARRAGVSEGSLFKRFRTKTDLFVAAMNIEGEIREWRDALLQAAGRAPIRPTLEAYGRHLLAHMQTVMPRILMVTSSGVQFARNYLPTSCPPLEHAATLTRYLRAEVRGGRLRLAHPEIQASIFVGALSHFVFCELVFNHRPGAHAAQVRTLVDNILHAGAPRAGARRTRQERNRP